MGSSQQATTTTTNSEPWAKAQPALERGLKDAENLYASGVGSQSYTGSTVIPFSQQTQKGMATITQNADRNMGGQGLQGQYQNIIDNGGYTAPQQQAMNTLGRFGQGDANVNTGVIDTLGQRAWGPSYTEQNLSDIASGGMLNRSDPNFERALGRASDEAANQVNMGASAFGRYGSGVHQGKVARTVGDLQANARVGQYNQERANQMAANQMLDTQRQANLNTALGAAQSSANIGLQNNAQRMGALQQYFNAGQQGMSNIGDAYAGMMAPARDMMGVGSMYEDLAGRLKNDELRIFNEMQNQPWNQLARLNGIASGAGQMGGSGTSTAQVPGQSPFATALGYGATGLGLLGSARNLGWF